MRRDGGNAVLIGNGGDGGVGTGTGKGGPGGTGGKLFGQPWGGRTAAGYGGDGLPPIHRRHQESDLG